MDPNVIQPQRKCAEWKKSHREILGASFPLAMIIFFLVHFISVFLSSFEYLGTHPSSPFCMSHDCETGRLYAGYDDKGLKSPTSNVRIIVSEREKQDFSQVAQLPLCHIRILMKRD